MTPKEIEAVTAALPSVGRYVALVGMNKGLEAYTKEQALRLVATAYLAVKEAMASGVEECEF